MGILLEDGNHAVAEVEQSLCLVAIANGKDGLRSAE